MKITRSQLKQLIQEESNKILEQGGFGKVRGDEARKQGQQDVTQGRIAKPVVSDDERGLVITLTQELMIAAELGNLATNQAALKHARLLSAELKKMISQLAPAAPQQPAAPLRESIQSDSLYKMIDKLVTEYIK